MFGSRFLDNGSTDFEKVYSFESDSFLPLDEAVFVIVSGSDGRADGRTDGWTDTLLEPAE